MSDPTEELLQAAEDLAAAFDIPVDAAVAKLRSVLVGEHLPLHRIKRMPWYLRLPLPMRWRQRWVYRQLLKPAGVGMREPEQS